MGITTATHACFTSRGHQNGYQDSQQESDEDALQESVEDRFQLMNAAGMGFFSIVFYALLKTGFAI
jgi:hypothetical protein